MTNYCLIGVPGAGKTFFATHRTVQKLKKRYVSKGKSGKFVLTNYPVVHPKYGSSIRWTPELMYLPLQNCYIIVDESYQYFGQNNKKNYKLDYEVFFGTVRHNDIDVLNIAHGMTRINPDIRVKSEWFYYIKKFCYPFSSKPAFFRLYGYYDMNFTESKQIEPVYTETILFRKSVANCYDSKYMRNAEFDMKTLPSWIDEPKKDLTDINNWIDIDNKKTGFDVEKINIPEKINFSFESFDDRIDRIIANSKNIDEDGRKMTSKRVNDLAKNGEIINWNGEIKDVSEITCH